MGKVKSSRCHVFQALLVIYRIFDLNIRSIDDDNLLIKIAEIGKIKLNFFARFSFLFWVVSQWTLPQSIEIRLTAVAHTWYPMVWGLFIGTSTRMFNYSKIQMISVIKIQLIMFEQIGRLLLYSKHYVLPRHFTNAIWGSHFFHTRMEFSRNMKQFSQVPDNFSTDRFCMIFW